MSLQQEGDDGCLGLLLASLLTSWQWSGYTIYGFNSSCSSAGVVVLLYCSFTSTVNI